MVKLTDGRIVIVETKGQEDLDVPSKMQRLQQWCDDVNKVKSSIRYDYLFIEEEGFKKYSPKSFKDLMSAFLNINKLTQPLWTFSP